MTADTEETKRSQLQKMSALGQFAGGIAHDFNNILSIIEGHTHIAVKMLKEGTLTPQQLQKILTSTQRGAGLTRQLLSFGRQSVGVEEKSNLGAALREQHILLRPLLGETIQLFMAIPEDPVWINASQSQLTQMVLNLALNARDAMPKGGELAILCMPCQKRHLPAFLLEKSKETSFIRLSVVDSGSGIPPDTVPRIFEPFFTTKDQGKGTGLGLSVVYGIVDHLGGGIDVSSTPGEGASFDLYLPMTTPPDVEVSFVDTSPKDLSGKTILIAEDESELRELLTDMFLGMNMKVMSAENGNRALVVQDEYDGKIDFLLTDVVMPEMDGVKLGEMFHSVRPDSSVVYMSGYPFMDGRKDIRVPQGAPFIGKPLQEDKIRQILARALERRRERLGE